MSAAGKAGLVNCALLLGLAVEVWRGAPWLAIAITAIIALPMANGLMYWKQKRLARGAY